MSVLTRYVFRRSVYHVLLLLAVVVGLLMFIDLVRQQGKIGAQEYTFLDGIIFTFSLVPARLTDIHVFVLFIGSFLTIIRLEETKEIRMMQALGMNQADVMKPFIILSSIWLSCFLFIGDIGTSLEYHAKKHRAQLMSQGKILSTHDAIWLRLDNQIIRFHLQENGEMTDLKRFNFSKNQLVGVDWIKEGRKEGDRWLFSGVQSIDLNDITKEPIQGGDFYINLNFDPNHFDLLNITPPSLTIKQLWDLSYLNQLGMTEHQYIDGVINRICQPFFLFGLYILTLSTIMLFFRSFHQNILLIMVLVAAGFSQALFSLLVSSFNALNIGFAQANIASVVFIFTLAFATRNHLKRV